MTYWRERGRGGDILINKRHIILIFLAFCLTATLLVSVTGSWEPYDPWMDVNDDGIIDIVDIVNLAIRYGEEGTPINKTELLLELQNRVTALETRIPQSGIISVSATAFVPRDESISYTNTGWLYNDNTDEYASFYAPVQLPHGVTVTKVSFYWFDNGTDYIVCALYRRYQNPWVMAGANSPAAEAPGHGFSYSDSITFPTVDNSNWAYYLAVNLPWGYNYHFKMAIIEYEYPA